MDSKLLDAAKRVDVPEASSGSNQATKTIENVFDAEKVTSTVEKQFPNAILNEAAIKGQSCASFLCFG
jgi:hypothetical protein